MLKKKEKNIQIMSYKVLPKIFSISKLGAHNIYKKYIYKANRLQSKNLAFIKKLNI